MKREIEFRGKSLDNGEWVYGLFCRTGSDGTRWHNVISAITETEVVYTAVIPDTVGQFTGLRDNKRTEEYPDGQKIYEGDLYKTQNPFYTYQVFIKMARFAAEHRLIFAIQLHGVDSRTNAERMMIF